VFSTNIITGLAGSQVNHVKEYTTTYSMADDFHKYTLEWTPEYVAWHIDTILLRKENGNLPDLLVSPESYRFNTWISCAPSWVGTLDRKNLPQYQYIDWIEYSRYENGNFVPEWRDDFDTFDTGRWSKGNWTFDCNQVNFTPDNAYIDSGKLVLALTDPSPVNSIHSLNKADYWEVNHNNSPSEIHVRINETGSYRYHLSDLSGRIISADRSEGESLIIPTAGIYPGIYLLNIQSENNSLTRKIFIQ
jgi:hypothetical protein